MSFKIVGIGEALWDLLPAGPQLGGAPANFAYHCQQMGAQSRVISRVGTDGLGQWILSRFAEMGINDGTVQVDDHLPTGTATVALDQGGTPRFTISEDVAWDAIEVTDKALAAAQLANAVCFGTLAQRSRTSMATIQRLVAASPSTAVRVFDINLRQGFYSRELIEQSLRLATVVKLNDTELSILSEMFALNGSVKLQIEQLVAGYDLQVLALTRGERGSLLYQQGQWSDRAGSTVKIVDTVGAGDSFTAALVMGLLHRLNLDDIHSIAAEVANFVCACPGAMPVLPEELRSAFTLHGKAG